MPGGKSARYTVCQSTIAVSDDVDFAKQCWMGRQCWEGAEGRVRKGAFPPWEEGSAANPECQCLVASLQDMECVVFQLCQA